MENLGRFMLRESSKGKAGVGSFTNGVDVPRNIFDVIHGSKPEGIYIHVPFCKIKCHYCDFVSGIPPKNGLVEEYFSALMREIDFFLGIADISGCRTIYFGGGTPGLFPKELALITEKILKRSSKIREITVEVNPSSDFNPHDFSFATRISFGVQTFSEKYLKFLGRDHTFWDSVRAIEKALRFFSVNADIIFGMPEQSPDEHLSDLKILASFGIHHISTYMLTPYENTYLGGLVRRGEISLPDDVSEFFAVQKFLYDFGYRRYEVSNFAKPSFECVHNTLYWERKCFLGLGVSAWSKVKNIRFANPKNVKQYISLVKNFGFAVKEVVEITPETELEEIIFLSLRMSKGLDREELLSSRVVLSALKYDPQCVDKFFLEVQEKLGNFLIFSYGENGKDILSFKVKEDFLFALDRIVVDVMLIAEKIFGVN